ncbi:MAG: ECF transporter S component [Propionicimonas sp.]|nr:ECF transporter S component [Propionicimonas sp.]
MSLSERAPDRTATPRVSARQLAVMAIFIALSAVGSLVKIPSPVGSVGLDSAPGFFAALAFGPWVGFVVIAVGHLLGSAIVGFPLTLPVHLAIAAGMGACALVFRWLGRRGGIWLVVAVVVTTVLNSVALGLIVLPIGGWGLYVAALPALFLGAVVNLVIAAVAYYAVRDSKLLR